MFACIGLAFPAQAAAEQLTITVAGAGTVTGSYLDPFTSQPINCTEAASPCAYTIPRSFCIPSPSNPTCPPQTLTLTASPASGARLRTWGGDCSGTSSTCTLSMSANRNVTATFLSSPLYVSPTGSTAPTAPCTQAAPCELDQTVEVLSQDGDEIVVLPGDYVLPPQLLVDEAVDLHGLEGAVAPRLVGAGRLSVGSPSATIGHLYIERTTSGDAVSVNNTAVTLSRLSVVSMDVAVGIYDHDVTVRDSILRSTGSSAALAAYGDTEAENVTAVSTGAGSYGILAEVQPYPVHVTLRNVIARGAAADLRAVSSDPDFGAVINVSYSNYRTATTYTEPSEPTATASINNLGNNQAAEPLFVNAAAGNFHQLPGSPTVDAGTSSAGSGPTDIDGDPRIIGSAPDIGADELVPPPPPPPDTGSLPPPPPPGCTIGGTTGADRVTGTPGNDVICTGRGNDIVNGGGGNDVIRLGPGNDKGYGQAGRDRIFGDAGRDRIVGGPGRDRLDGGRGRDICIGRGDIKRRCP